MPDATIASISDSTLCSVRSTPEFHEFQPIGGAVSIPVRPVCGGAVLHAATMVTAVATQNNARRTSRLMPGRLTRAEITGATFVAIRGLRPR